MGGAACSAIPLSSATAFEAILQAIFAADLHRKSASSYLIYSWLAHSIDRMEIDAA